MQAGVPQFIDVEDKIAFGLTGKQLLWMGAAVALLVVSYGLFNRQVFYAIAFFVVVIFGALAFWRPQGVSMVTFIGFSLYFFLKPKKYIWKRVYKSGNIDLKKAALAQRKNAPPTAPPKHLPGGGSLKRIAWELDTKK
jgi:hypothetical protein